MSELKFILFNNVIINTIHIHWCEKIRRNYGEDETFGIRIVVNSGTGCSSFDKWFKTQEDRDKEFKHLSDNVFRTSKGIM